MGERVYPGETPPVSGEHPKPMVDSPPVSGGPYQYHRPTMSQESFSSSVSKTGYPGYGGPQPGTYVVQVPKDQIYRVPPPENAHKYKLYTQKKGRRSGSRCRCCICSTLAAILVLALLLAVAVGVFYLMYSPKVPSYTIDSLHVKGVNLSELATSSTISPVFNLTVKTDNPNSKIGIYYEQGSSVNVYHDGVNFCTGSLPAFYQPPKSVTLFSTQLRGAGIVLSKSARDKLLTEQKQGKVPLQMDVRIPLKVKVAGVKSWTFSVKVSCQVTLNALADNAKLVSKDCSVHANPW